MKIKLKLVVSFLFISIICNAQKLPGKVIDKPKVVIGLVIDQMRWDFLYRYYEQYSPTGFKRLLNEGFSCENTFIPYVPTYTGPGHTCIYTGSVPAIHGIIGNNWYERSINKSVYCTEDSTVTSVGGSMSWGRNSPRTLWTTTITDELRISNNFKSRVFAASLKDRASILPGGHSANAAYWYDESLGKWITSSYYMNELPVWLQKINDKRMPDVYMSKDWQTLLPLSKYELSTGDNKPYEENLRGEATPTFPHKLSLITDRKYEVFKTTPFANTYTFDLAKSLIENEKIGSNGVTDFLAINIASTDLVGHAFGPNSIEIHDTYLRLDKDLSDFLLYLDNKFGKGNYLLFLSADHGVANVPGFLMENKIPAGLFRHSNLLKEINQLIETNFSLKRVVVNLQNSQLYLNNDELIKSKKQFEIKETIINYLKQQPYIIHAFETDKIALTSISLKVKEMHINGYNPKRSGDIQFIAKAGYFERGGPGTTHGSWNPYDSHIPLVWFGWNVKQGRTNRETYMTDIAPTLAAMLKIQMPSGSIGNVIQEIMK